MKKLFGLACLIILIGAGCTKSENFGGGFQNAQNNNLQTVSSTPVGADGNLQFATTGLFNSSNNLRWDNSNSRLGINTTTAGSALTVDLGDVYVASSTRGLIRKLPNGSCLRFTVDNSGYTVTSTLTCPS